MSLNILFVDDDSRVLGLLKNTVECESPEWSPRFADSGDQALQILSNQEMDVIVSDMCMQGMDGADLLTQVASQFPDVVRIVLSGMASEEAVYRAVSPMHQYLAKPCDITALNNSLARAFALRDILQSERLQNLVTRISHLPTTPSVYKQLLDELASDDHNAASIGDIVAVEPSLTAKILQIVNSAIVGLSRPCHSIAQAVGILGTDAIKSLVLSAGTYNQFDNPSIPELSIEKLSTHGLNVGKLAEEICHFEQLDSDIANSAFTAGLLHDIGKLILATEFSEEYQKIFDESKQSCSLFIDEVNQLGTHHGSVGAYLFALWGLPHDVVEAVALHHEPNLAGSQFSSVTAVAAANCLLSHDPGSPHHQNVFQHLDEIGVRNQLDSWSELIDF